MIAAPRAAFRPAGSPVWLPTRAPSYRGGGSSPVVVPRAVSLTGVGSLRGDIADLMNASGLKLGLCTLMAWIKPTTAPADTYSNLFGLIKPASLYSPNRFLQMFTGVDGVPAQRLRVTCDAGGGTIQDATTSPEGHGYLPQALMTVGTWMHVALVKTGAVDTNTYQVYINGVADCVGTASPTPAEMSELWLGNDNATPGVGTTDANPFSYACVRIWRELALTQAQVQAEKNSATPVLSTKYSDAAGVGLFRNWRLDGTDDLADSVDATAFSSSGTVTTDTDGPLGIAA